MSLSIFQYWTKATMNPIKRQEMIDKLGVVRKAFGSIQEAATFVGLKCYSNISRCCSGERKSAACYYWKFCTLPKGSIKKLIGRKLSFTDEPVELKEDWYGRINKGIIGCIYSSIKC